MLSFTGNDLRIAINCNYLPHHHWMVFSSWYSIYKNLPDASVKIFCNKNIRLEVDDLHELFGWVPKVKVEFSYKKGNPDFQIDCDVMAIREWTGPDICDASSKDITTFCTYRAGCGNFVMAEWINTITPPFSRTDDFKKEVMTVNEVKILEFWRKSLPTYVALG